MTLYDITFPSPPNYHRETADHPSWWRKLEGNRSSDIVPINYKFRTSAWFPCCFSCF